jgi:alanyl-tRNA synthetase
MKSSEIRRSFLEFFESKQHRIVPSAPVVTHGDPTLMFINAGMNQFKDVFLGTGTRDYKRAADTQKCIRVSGKHNDLEEVGRDTYHHTFFEMLGNWSFGDYYKEEAIAWAWELLTEVWKMPKDRLFVTCYKTDSEAFEIWKKYMPEDRILYFGDKENFWEMGETGPCGPCSEIHFDRTPDKSGRDLVNADSPDVIEIWNLVFIQYNRKADGSLENLSARHVDTGMGFERVCSVIQGKNSNYETDVFMPLINKLSELSGKTYLNDLDDPDSIAMRVIADHTRTLSFAIADGAIPGNEGRSYVLRRILRRASRFARNLGFREAVMTKLVGILVDTMGEVFPELIENRATIEKVIRGEEENFLQTLDRGLTKFDELAKLSENNEISGSDAFLLYDTFGFPLDLTELIARERHLSVDIAGFNQSMSEQKQRARAARKSVSQEVETIETDSVSTFVGYDTIEVETTVEFAQDNKIVLARTPFYAESGGQMSDMGMIVIGKDIYNVLDVKRVGNAIIHIIDKNAVLEKGTKVIAKVNRTRRLDIARNHSATHLAHEALKTVLGGHIKQAGSLVHPDYLRFDFNHFEKLTDEQIKEIERIVNEKILSEIDIETNELSLEEARKDAKIKMFFGDKYGDTVRCVVMSEDFSVELCGGTHVRNTSEIGLFKITTESSVAAGVRRMEAVTGRGAMEFVGTLQNKIIELTDEIGTMQKNFRKLEKDISDIKREAMEKEISQSTHEAKMFGEIKVIAKQIDVDSLDALRDAAVNLRDTLAHKAIVLLAVVIDEKVQLACSVTDDINGKYPAGKLVGLAAKELGGGGGGKAHLATAGGRNIEKLPEVLENFIALIENM